MEGFLLTRRLTFPTRPVTTVTTRRKPFVAHLVFFTVVLTYTLAVGQNWAIYASAVMTTIWLRSPNDFKNRLW